MAVYVHVPTRIILVQLRTGTHSLTKAGLALSGGGGDPVSSSAGCSELQLFTATIYVMKTMKAISSGASRTMVSSVCTHSEKDKYACMQTIAMRFNPCQIKKSL
jgi:hypothetical protein